MRPHLRRREIGICLCVVTSLWAGCDDQAPANDRGTGSGASGGKPGAVAVAKAQAQAGLVLKDDDFVESERHRDPFRGFSLVARTRTTEPVADTQRPVIMPDTAVEDMQLIAVISGLDRPKAMLLDTHKVGYVVQRGDYIGKPKVFQSTGSVAMTLNWRVDRIRENEVVLTRQDPSDLGRPPISRIISMRDEVAAAR